MGTGNVVASSQDREAGLSVTCRLTMTPEGVLLLDYSLTNEGGSPLGVSSLLPSLPVPAYGVEVLDLTGRWARERVPQRHPLHQGAWVRESRHGRTGHDATLLMVAGTTGFTFGHGQVWGMHPAWSGDHVSYAESTPEGDCRLGAGELLQPSEVVIGPGDSYAAPTVAAAWSDAGLDGLSHRLHAHVRSMPHLANIARPVFLNTWEAVYFDQDLDTLIRLADAAATAGVERFVLDDGWFHGRTDDQRGLGDWTVDEKRWPDGLHPLISHVRDRGMDFGLWVEPEMVNLDSDLIRANPGWVLKGRDELPMPWRQQQVIDLQNDDAYAYLRDAMFALLDEYDIAYLKWDHNRDVIDASHEGVPAIHGQTLALYRLLDEIGARHPRLEIETCASGGGRIDLGIIRRTHRVWASDTNDALERMQIQRWTSLLLPPELIGSHVGALVSHTTGRAIPLPFRCAAALFGSFGVEWNLLEASAEDLRVLSAWIALHKQVRPVLARGALVRGDHPDPSLMVSGLISPERDLAWFRLAQLASSHTTQQTPVLITGLDPQREYVVERVDPPAHEPASALDTWTLDEGPLRLSGAALAILGIQPPVLGPQTARVLKISSV